MKYKLLKPLLTTSAVSVFLIVPSLMSGACQSKKTPDPTQAPEPVQKPKQNKEIKPTEQKQNPKQETEKSEKESLVQNSDLQNPKQENNDQDESSNIEVVNLPENTKSILGSSLENNNFIEQSTQEFSLIKPTLKKPETKYSELNTLKTSDFIFDSTLTKGWTYTVKQIKLFSDHDSAALVISAKKDNQVKDYVIHDFSGFIGKTKEKEITDLLEVEKEKFSEYQDAILGSLPKLPSKINTITEYTDPKTSIKWKTIEILEKDDTNGTMKVKMEISKSIYKIGDLEFTFDKLNKIIPEDSDKTQKNREKNWNVITTGYGKDYLLSSDSYWYDYGQNNKNIVVELQRKDEQPINLYKLRIKFYNPKVYPLYTKDKSYNLFIQRAAGSEYEKIDLTEDGIIQQTQDYYNLYDWIKIEKPVYKIKIEFISSKSPYYASIQEIMPFYEQEQNQE